MSHLGVGARQYGSVFVCATPRGIFRANGHYKRDLYRHLNRPPTRAAASEAAMAQASEALAATASLDVLSIALHARSLVARLGSGRLQFTACACARAAFRCGALSQRGFVAAACR